MSEKIIKFVSELPNNFPNYGLRRQDDTKDKKILKARSDTIEKYNSGEAKFGIFFSPNGEYHTLEKLSDKNTGRCFAICASSTQKSFWEKFGLKPSIVNQTKDRFDCFWLLKEAISVEEFENISLQLESIYLLGFGKSVRDVYRLPGTVCWDDNKGQEKTLTVIYENIKYSKQDFLEFIIPFKNIEIKSNTARDKHQGASKTQRQTYETINNIDIFKVWKELGADVEYKDGVIYKEGKPTDFLYIKDYNRVYSKSNDEIGGNPYLLAKTYLKTQEEIYKFFSEKFNIGQIYDEETEIVKSNDEEYSTVTITTPAGDIIFDWEDKSTDIMVKNTRTQIIDGYLKPIGFYIKNKIKVCLVKYFKKNGETGIIELESLGQTNKLDIMLSRNLLTYFGSAKVKKYIQSYVQDGTEEYIYIDKLGIYSKDLVINEAGSYILEVDNKKYYISIEDETVKSRESMFEFEKGVMLNDVVKQLDNIKSIYKSSIVGTMFTHFALSMCIKGIIDLENIEMPYGILVGLTQSGKTYTRKLLMKMFGLKSQFEVQASTTLFVVLKKMRHYLPINVGEYNNEEIKFDWDHYLKTLYDRTNEARGTSGQTINMYEANGTMFVDGENKSTNMAVYTRGIVYFMNPRYRMNVDDINQVTKSFKNILGYFIENFEKIKEIPSHIQIQRKRVNKALEGVDVPDKVRIASNYSLLLAFAESFGFCDLIIDDVLEQMHEQIKMMGDNNVDKIIKNVMTLAISYDMVCDIDNDGILRIDFIVDILRNSTKKIDSLLSDISTVNHQFGTRGDNSQTLGIPIDYIFKNKSLHIISNNIFNMIYERSNDFNMVIARKVYEYAKENKFTKSRFAAMIEGHPEFNGIPF